ncbi:MAG: histidinol-phosphate transaminase [Patescibacteria group bacterium]
MIRKNIQNLKPYVCARDLYQSGIFLDANENSFGSVLNDYKSLKINRYPDPYATDFKKALSKYLKISSKYIFCGVGSDELIDLIFKIYLDLNNNIIINKPTYGMYQVVADINNINTKNVLLDDNFDIDLQAINNQVDKKTKIIIACSPNNPTGNLLSKKKILKLCQKYTKKIVLLDEAYIEFSSQASLIQMVKKYPNLIIIRTLSKAWGLAGLRLGYAVANPGVILALNKVKAPYNINSISQYLGTKALKNKKQMSSFKKVIIKERNKLINELKKINIPVFKSETNFLLIQVKCATEIYNKLAKKYGIIIRNRTDEPKLNNCLRITIGTPEQNKKLIKALTNILNI